MKSVTGKVFFNTNIKHLRARAGQSQEEAAASLGITRIKLQQLESGKTKNPPVDDLLNFSNHYKISVDTLLRIDLSKLGELKIRQLQAGNDGYITGTSLRILPITVTENNKENVEYVPVKAKAGYLAGLQDPDYIASLPKLSMPQLPQGKTYRMFPTVGDSMLPIPEGAEVLTTYVADWTSLKPDTLCVIILKGMQDFVFKQVTVQADGTMLLKSLNPLYKPYIVSLADVLEVWQYYQFQSQVLPPSAPENEMLSMVKAIYQKLK